VFAYFRHEGVARVVCEEKHMGSRAVVVLCRDEAAVRSRFGIEGDSAGICYTRTGRRFFDDRTVETTLLDRLRAAAEAAGLFSALESDWLVLDAELMPWSAKAQALLREQYAPTGAAATAVLERTLEALEQAGRRGIDTGEVSARTRARAEMARGYVEAYGRYCWRVASVDDLRLAPFHLLASEGMVHVGRDHRWHLETLGRLAGADPRLLVLTRAVEVDVTDPASTAAGIAWWTDLTAAGGEGMVVKPLEFVARGQRGLVQPGMKCRGLEYLRIIYGPEYTAPEHLERLRSRAVATKRSLALREFALGVEGLERFVRCEPLRRVHECVFMDMVALHGKVADAEDTPALRAGDRRTDSREHACGA
jgi:protein phosphatase